MEIKVAQMRSRLSIAALALALLPLAPSLHAACTTATMLGNWGFTANGVLILPTGAVPVGAVGTARFDLGGNISGSQERSLGGGVQHETFSGNFSITHDCALAITTNVYDDSGTLQRTTTLKGVVINCGKGVRMIYESITLPNGAALPSVLTLDGNRI